MLICSYSINLRCMGIWATPKQIFSSGTDKFLVSQGASSIANHLLQSPLNWILVHRYSIPCYLYISSNTILFYWFIFLYDLKSLLRLCSSYVLMLNCSLRNLQEITEMTPSKQIALADLLREDGIKSSPSNHSQFCTAFSLYGYIGTKISSGTIASDSEY